MKFLRPLLLLSFIMSTTQTFSQKYRISSCPIDGCFYVDTTAKNQVIYSHSNKCVDIVSDNNIVYASGKGRVIYCTPKANKTYEIGIKYSSAIIVYANVTRKRIFKDEIVEAHAPIGELILNPKDKHYHLGLQVVKADNPGEILWGSNLARYLNASLADN